MKKTQIFGLSAARRWPVKPPARALIAIALLLLFPAAATAQYPGQNGKLVVEHNSASQSTVTDVNVDSGQGTNSTEVPTPASGIEFPSYSADGAVLVYHDGNVTEPTSGWVLRRRSPTTGSYGSPQPIRVTGYDVVVSPDGSRIAYDVPTGQGVGCSDVYTANVDGSAVVDLTALSQTPGCASPGQSNGFAFGQPRWSGDGMEIAVRATLQPGGFNRDEIAVFRVSDRYLLFSQMINAYLGGFDLSPDGAYVVVANGCYSDCPYVSAAASNVFILPVNGGAQVGVTNSTTVQFGRTVYPQTISTSQVSWSPDGKRIAVTSTPNANYNAYNPGTAPPPQPEQVVVATLCCPSTVPATTAVWTAPSGNDVPNDIWWVPQPQVNADITAGPSGTTNQPSPTFEFTSTTAGAIFECSLDGAAFASCSSPDTLGSLPDGPHSFQVRAHLPGQPFGRTASRSWTIDTVRPVVTIDSAPSGGGNPSTVTLSFHAQVASGNGGGAFTFTCSLDGGAPQPCASPDTLAGLADGPHSLSIAARDALGNTSASPATATWTVGGTPGAGAGPGGAGQAPPAPNAGAEPPATSSCAAGQSRASYGLIFLVGRSGTCLLKQNIGPGVTAWRAAGPVTLNGITLTPDPGSVISLTSSGVFEISGPSTVELGSLASVHIPFAISWSADASGTVTAARESYAFVADIGGLKPLPGIPDYFPTIKLSKDNGGTATLTQSLGLPDALSALPGKPGGITVSVTIAASNDKGVTLGGQVAVKDLYLGALHLSDLAIGYDGQARTWDGTVSLELVSGGPKVTVAATIGPPDVPALIGCCLEKFSIVAENINKPIPSTPLFLQTLGGSASREVAKDGSSFLKIGGRAGISIGPDIPHVGPAVLFDGSVQLSLATPWVLEVSGSASVFGKPLAAAQAIYTHGQGVELSGELNETIKGYGAQAKLEHTFFGSDGTFNIEGTGSVALGTLGSQAASVIFSNRGFAACATVHTPAGSYALGWGELIDGTSQVLSGVCDFAPYRVTAAAAERATAAGAVRTLTLTAGKRPRLLAVHGAGAAPLVSVRGPGGLRLAGGASGSAKTSDGLVIADPAHNTTYVVLDRSVGGRYDLTAANTAITSVREADALPELRPRASTSGLPGGKRRLVFSQNPVTGQQVELLEQGDAGGGQRLLTTAAARKTLIYRPMAGLGRRRSIVAVTLMHGLVRDRRVLTTYAVADRPPARVRGLALHHGVLTWRPVSGAARYLVAVLDRRGASTTVSTRVSRLAVRAGTVRVTVEAVDTVDRPGPAALLAVRSTSAPGPPKRIPR